MSIQAYQNFFKTLRKLFSKNLSGKFSKISGISEKFPTGNFSEIFRKIVGNFFIRPVVREPPKIPPGLSRKKWRLFVRIRFGNACFLHKFRGKIQRVSLRIRTVSRKIPGEISPGIPGNSGGKIRGFFPVFSRFPGCNAGFAP